MCTEFKVEKLDYAVNSLEDSNQDSENVLFTICENSEGSQDLMAIKNEDVQYKVMRNNPEGVLQYRLLCSSPGINTTNMNVITPSAVNNSEQQSQPQQQQQQQVQSTNCHFYVINDQPTNRPCLISPKIAGVQNNVQNTNTRHILGCTKKRDEKRRATHNEVERRRRDKINHWIYKLKELLPDNSNDSKSKTNGSDSKGGILIKACEYIIKVQEENESLTECLKETDKTSLENKVLKDQIEEISEKYERISSENELLKNQIAELTKQNYRLNKLIGKSVGMDNSSFGYDSP